MNQFGTSLSATPILNTPQFASIFTGTNLPLDEQGLLRAVETIAFPRTKIQLIKTTDHPFIWQVALPHDYPSKQPLYADVRFLQAVPESYPDRIKKLPPGDLILERMEKLVGTEYLWGGNWLGIPEIATYYPPSAPIETLDPKTRMTWLFNGIDCSGLLYLTTDGASPRNTSDLIHWGEEVSMDGAKSPREIQARLRALDAVVWPGHIFFILDRERTIESRLTRGVVVTDLLERFDELLKKGNRFSVRRFITTWR